LSADGLTVAIGARENDGNGTSSGHVRIYRFNDVTSQWEQIGQDIDGEEADDDSGRSVSLSSDGLIVAIGARFNDGNGFSSGHVRVYRFNDVTSQWEQLGLDIDGEASGDSSGASVSLSSNGLTVAIGAPGNDGNGTRSGHTRIHNFNAVTNQWEQLGQDIDGEVATDELGESVSLSSDGLTVAIGTGAPENAGNDSNSGLTQIHRLGQSPHYFIVENMTFVTDVLSSDDVDAEGSGIVYSLSGVDAQFFNIDSETGVISFVTAPDFERPLDNDSDNDYHIVVTVSDSDNMSDQEALLITVSSINEQPSIAGLEDVIIDVNDGGIMEFTILDMEDDNLTVTATSSNQVLIPNSSLMIAGADGSYSLELVPAGVLGMSVITVTVSDGVNVSTESFSVTVVNKPPSISNIADRVIGFSGEVVNFVVADEEEPEELMVTVSSSNQALISSNSLTISSIGRNYSLEILHLDGVEGTATITITASDGLNIVSESFKVTVVNQRPQLVFSGGVLSGLWTQLGADIDGEAADDLSGGAVSLSADGLTVAIGAPENDGNGDGAGHTRIYQFNKLTSQWGQLGVDIDGEVVDDNSGESVSLSADGLTVAIGAPNNDGSGLRRSGHVRVYRYNQVTNQWEQIGEDIDGEAAVDDSGESVSLSADGLIVAIGAPNNDGSGHVRVYRYNQVANQWEQIGQDIDGEVNDSAGSSVSLSSNGLTVAIGADGQGADGQGNGRARIYRFDDVTNQWEQVGPDIEGENGRDASGFSVSLNGKGDTIAIGAPFNDENGTSSGHTRIYKYNVFTSEWEQLGLDIDGEASRDFSGEAVSLSKDGLTVVIGATGNDDGGNFSGHARIYQLNEITDEWEQLGADIDGVAELDRAGASVSISADAQTVTIGSPENRGEGDGHTRIFRYKPIQSYTIVEQTTIVTDVSATDDLDSEVSGLIFSLSGDDEGLLSISETGLISFNTAPVFANPSDADGDNVYKITVTVTDSGGLSDSEDVEITVVPTTAVTTITTNPDGSVVFQVPSIPGATYAVEYSEDLGIWNIVEGEIEATGTSFIWTDTGPPSTLTHPDVTDKRFYRFRLLSTP